MHFDEDVRQPVLTSHEVTRTGSRRGKQHYVVSAAKPDPGAAQRRTPNPRQGQGSDARRAQKPRPSRKRPDGFDHDQVLRAHKGKVVRVLLASSPEPLEAVLIDCDRYTLLFKAGEDSLLIFKSSIDAIELPKQDN